MLYHLVMVDMTYILLYQTLLFDIQIIDRCNKVKVREREKHACMILVHFWPPSPALGKWEQLE